MPRSLKQQLAERTGLSLGLLQRPAMAGFVKRRCQELGLADELAYHQLRDARLRRKRSVLVKEVSVPETWFFRYPASFELLIDHCRVCCRQSHNELRMLSIACATGEEPYSMTMAALQAGWPLDRIVIDAIDRHEASLAIARRAFYRRYFISRTHTALGEPLVPNRRGRRAGRRARSWPRVTFLCHDILSGIWPRGRAAVRHHLLSQFVHLSRRFGANEARRLLPPAARSAEGLLFVGHAEFPILPSESFESAGVKRTFALRRRDVGGCYSEPSPRRPLESRARTPFAGDDRARSAPATKTGDSAESLPNRNHRHQHSTLADARALADAGRLEEAIAVPESWPSGSSTPPCVKRLDGADFFELLGQYQAQFGPACRRHVTHSTRCCISSPITKQSLLQMAIISDRLGNAEQASRFRRRAIRAHDRRTPAVIAKETMNDPKKRCRCRQVSCVMTKPSMAPRFCGCWINRCRTTTFGSTRGVSPSRWSWARKTSCVCSSSRRARNSWRWRLSGPSGHQGDPRASYSSPVQHDHSRAMQLGW